MWTSGKFYKDRVRSMNVNCILLLISYINRADCRFAPSQSEAELLCNDVSRWLGANLESSLKKYATIWKYGRFYTVYVFHLLWRKMSIRFSTRSCNENTLWFYLLIGNYWQQKQNITSSEITPFFTNTIWYISQCYTVPILQYPHAETVWNGFTVAVPKRFVF